MISSGASRPKESRSEIIALALTGLALVSIGLVLARIVSGTWRAVAAPFIAMAAITLTFAAIVALLSRLGITSRPWWSWLAPVVILGLFGAVWDAVNPPLTAEPTRTVLLAGSGVVLSAIGAASNWAKRHQPPTPLNGRDDG